MNRKILLIANPCSGKKAGRKKAEVIVRYLSDDKNTVTVKKTAGRGDATQIAEKYGNDYDLIACSGGDGTFNEVINGIVQLEHKVPVAYIPNGTTNDTAKTLSLPTNLADLAKIIKEQQYNKCDLGLFNDRHFFCAVSFGFGAKASFTTKQSLKNHIGHIAYILSGIKNISDIRPIEMDIEFDNQNISGEFIFGAVINTKSVGGIFKIDDKTFRINDGKFEIVLVRKLNSAAELPLVLMKLQKQEYDGKQVIMIQANDVTFTSPHPVSWLIDGEHGGDLKTVHITNLSQFIEVCSLKSNIFI